MNAPVIPASPVGSDATSVRELAARLYVELAGRAMLPSEKVKPNPLDLAKYCYKLAEAFKSVEDEAQKEALAKMAKYDVKVDDMARWKK